MPMPQALSKTMNALILGIALTGAANAQETTPPPAQNPAPVETPAPEAKQTECKISGRTILAAALGSILKSAGNKSNVEGLGRSAGELGQGAIAPECSKNPEIKPKIIKAEPAIKP